MQNTIKELYCQLFQEFGKTYSFIYPNVCDVQFLVGDFNYWDRFSTPLYLERNHSIAHLDLLPGLYEYQVIDSHGEFQIDPLNSSIKKGAFGNLNSVFGSGNNADIKKLHDYWESAWQYWLEAVLNEFKNVPVFKKKPKQIYRFALIGDTQNSNTMTPLLLEKISELDVDAVIHLGDMIMSAGYPLSWAHAAEIFAKAGIPLIFVPGNHDRETVLGVYDHFRKYADLFLDCIHGKGRPIDLITLTAGSLKYGLILLDTDLLDSSDRSQTDMFLGLMKTTDYDHLFAMGHDHNKFEHFLKELGMFGVVQDKLTAVFSGHIHNLDYNKNKYLNGHFVSGAGGANVNAWPDNLYGFYLLELTSAGFNIRTHEFGGEILGY